MNPKPWQIWLMKHRVVIRISRTDLLLCCRLLLCITAYVRRYFSNKEKYTFILHLSVPFNALWLTEVILVFTAQICPCVYLNSLRGVCLYVGGRSSQAIVEAALNAARSLVKDRLSGKSGGSDYSRQVLKYTNLLFYLFILIFFFSVLYHFINFSILSDF